MTVAKVPFGKVSSQATVPKFTDPLSFTCVVGINAHGTPAGKSRPVEFVKHHRSLQTQQLQAFLQIEMEVQVKPLLPRFPVNSYTAMAFDPHLSLDDGLLGSSQHILKVGAPTLGLIAFERLD
jgi:hypothetical protein